MAGYQAPTLPFAPLWTEVVRQIGVEDLSISGAARHMGLDRTQVYRCLRSGRIAAERGDDIAVRLGLHPLEVFGQAWVDYIDGVLEAETCASFAELLAADGIHAWADRRKGTPRLIMRADAVEQLATRIYGSLWRSKLSSSKLAS